MYVFLFLSFPRRMEGSQAFLAPCLVTPLFNPNALPLLVGPVSSQVKDTAAGLTQKWNEKGGKEASEKQQTTWLIIGLLPYYDVLGKI